MLTLNDALGKNISIGDRVAVVYHPQAYEFTIEIGTIEKVDDRYVYVDIPGKKLAKYLLPENGTVGRIVQLPVHFASEESENCDAVGQAIHIGDYVVARKQIELGNTCKGFEAFGTVTRFTDAYTYSMQENNVEIRKKTNHVVVVDRE